MSTSYYVYCETCGEAVTDPDGFDNSPEVPLAIVANVIAYAHLALIVNELPVPENAWLEVDVKISGQRLDLSGLRKHVSHQMAVYDEYGFVYPSKSCSHCHRRFCVNVKNRGGCGHKVCCVSCDH